MNSNCTKKRQFLLVVASNVIQLALQIWNETQSSKIIQNNCKKCRVDFSKMIQLTKKDSDDMEMVLHAINSELECEIIGNDLSVSQ